MGTILSCRSAAYRRNYLTHVPQVRDLEGLNQLLAGRIAGKAEPCMAGPGLVAYIVTSKFSGCLPTLRKMS